LREVAELGGDLLVPRGAGVESEVELAFAALHQLLRPVLTRLGRLPAPRASALRGAFGLAETEPTGSTSSWRPWPARPGGEAAAAAVPDIATPGAADASAR
jgi:hypothetical protein